MSKAEYRRSEILSGVFVTLAVLAFGLFAFRVGSFDVLRSLKGASVACVADFADVKSLVAGAPVAVAGRRVGEVTDLRLVQRVLTEEQHAALVGLLGADAFPGLESGMTRQVVEVAFELHAADVRLDPVTAQVALAQDGLLGPYFLDLDPGYWEGDRPPALDEYPDLVRIHSREGPGLDAVLARMAPAIDHLTHVLELLEDELLSAENLEQLAAVLEDLRGGMGEIRAALDRESPEGLQATVVRPLGDLLRNADETLTVLRKRLLEETLVQAESLMQDGARVLASAERLTAEAESLLGELNPRAVELLDDLGATTRELEKSIARIEEEVASTLELSRDVVAENRPEVAESLRRLRRTMWEAEMALRKIRANPAYLVFGDDEQLLDALPADTGDVERSGRARPYAQRDEGDGE